MRPRPSGVAEGSFGITRERQKPQDPRRDWRSAKAPDQSFAIFKCKGLIRYVEKKEVFGG